jgi:hypothetical protein
MDDSVGINIQETWGKMVDSLNSPEFQGIIFSQKVEKLENMFSPRESAFLIAGLARKLSDANHANGKHVELDGDLLPPGLKEKLDAIARAQGVDPAIGGTIAVRSSEVPEGLLDLLKEARGACMCPACTAERDGSTLRTSGQSKCSGEGGNA